ncbi:MAG TPA: hypothetical protein VGN72_07870 [Tepidisphaeraceae bacterium]|jgi:hypothetical protein|nr:hypothetical protein [Tepidisphaeraceae bacterium]
MRKKKPFSIYPRQTDHAAATQLADEMDLHISQIYLLGFRAFVKRRNRKLSAAMSVAGKRGERSLRA